MGPAINALKPAISPIRVRSPPPGGLIAGFMLSITRKLIFNNAWTLMIEALIQSAEARGYRIRWHRGGPKAAWIPGQNAITVQIGMDDVTTLCSLAHELGHAHYNDPPGHFGAHELRADRFAARLLVAPGDYAAAEGVYGSHPAVLASELGVTVKIITVWQELHTRRAAPLAG